MFTSLPEFFQVWRAESEGTLRIFSALTDRSLQQSVTAQDRTLGRIAWHIVTTIPEMMARTGLEFSSIDPDSPVPATAQEIVEAYRLSSENLLSSIGRSWTDDTLQAERNLYGESWKNSFTLQVLINHQIHHRGQMTVLMRQAGLAVPGIYGPSREEWGQYGMETPEL
ncbi:DinB family protein [Heliobacterium chlorum]|uniref:DinB family protein n=1 Tax=Heliobacterium chlorum TaxID=2698 RepID=A0ABR7T1S4_HELCL|nr:DinB family protein [Heliobacterium chlorum]MBC9784743.1 DinB family protein [Heliobacterium chlorum]